MELDDELEEEEDSLLLRDRSDPEPDFERGAEGAGAAAFFCSFFSSSALLAFLLRLSRSESGLADRSLRRLSLQAQAQRAERCQCPGQERHRVEKEEGGHSLTCALGLGRRLCGPWSCCSSPVIDSGHGRDDSDDHAPPRET